MKTKIYLTAFLGVVIQVVTYCQTQNANVDKNQTSFNFSYWTTYVQKLNLNLVEQKEFISSHQRTQLSFHSQNFPPATNKQNPQSIFAGPCINIDYENGNLNGWTTSSGYHPLFNPTGCCTNSVGQQIITSGTGIDPLGNFPIVAPGGNFSLRLGNNINGGEADRVEQTFFVTPSNANFSYQYAVVFQDPGHISSQQPAFQIEMLDSSGVQVPCTFYNVVSGGNIPGFFNSPNMAGVVYKPWSTVIVDLTNYIGQNITIRFTTFDCALGGHFGYAYIDGNCQALTNGTSDTICSGALKNYCAPNGLGSYVWNGPGVVNNTNQCISASVAGIYTCQTTLMSGCSGPIFTYTLSNFTTPVVSFNNASANACAQQYTFTNTSSIASGFIASYNWNFANLSNNSQQNTVYTFPPSGTYPVTLTAISNKGCQSTATKTISIFPYPVASFLAPNTCVNGVVNFSNTSSIAIGTIINTAWAFGNGNTSTLFNPNQNYSNSGSYTITLSVTSNQNCVSTVINTITIYPVPNVSFSFGNVCQGSNSSFINTSSITSGSIVGYIWDFDSDGQVNSFSINPTFIYSLSGTYTASLTTISNFNCINSATTLINIYANPTASFEVKNACFGQSISFTNKSTIANGNQILSYSLNLGNGSFTNTPNMQYNYNLPGTYTVQLTAVSNQNCINSYSSVATVFHLPNVNFIAGKACQNQATQFYNSTVINSGTITKWRWDYENDGIWDDTLAVKPMKVYPSAGNFNCKMQAVSNFQCVAEKVNPVVVHVNPTADFFNKPVCLGDVSTFTNTSISTDGTITSYLWDFNGDNVFDNASMNPGVTYSTNGTFLVKMEIQTVYGCISTRSKSMRVNPKPIPDFSADNKSGCPSLCVSFNNLSSISTGSIVAMQWTFGDNSTPVHEKNPSHCYNSGNYDVGLILMSDSGCISVLKKQNFVTVFPKTLAGFKVQPDELDELDPTIHVQSTASGADQTIYFVNDQFTTLSENFDHTFKNLDQGKPLIFQIVRNEYGCADTAYHVVNIKPSFVIYFPNTFTPDGDGINDGWFAKGVGISKFNVQVYDRWGEIIFETNNIYNSWDGSFRGNSGLVIKQDAYVWKANVVDIFNRTHEFVGTVTLLK